MFVQQSIARHSVKDLTSSSEIRSVAYIRTDVYASLVKQNLMLYKQTEMSIEEKINFNSSIKNVFKHSAPGYQLTKQALIQFNQIVHYMAKSIISRANSVMQNSSKIKKTCTKKHVLTGVALFIPVGSTLIEECRSEAGKALRSYETSDRGDGQRQNKEKRAGILFQVSRCDKLLRSRLEGNVRLENGADVILAASLQCLTEAIVKLTIYAAKTKKRVTVDKQHMRMALIDKIDDENSESVRTIFRCTNLV